MQKTNYPKKVLWLATILIPLCTFLSCEEKSSATDNQKHSTISAAWPYAGSPPQGFICAGVSNKTLFEEHHVNYTLFNQIVVKYFDSIRQPIASLKVVPIETIVNLFATHPEATCATHAIKLVDSGRIDNEDITITIVEKAHPFIKPFFKISLFVAILDSFKSNNIKEFQFSKGRRYDAKKGRDINTTVFKVIGKDRMANSGLLYQGDYSTEDPE